MPCILEIHCNSISQLKLCMYSNLARPAAVMLVIVWLTWVLYELVTHDMYEYISVWVLYEFAAIARSPLQWLPVHRCSDCSLTIAVIARAPLQWLPVHRCSDYPFTVAVIAFCRPPQLLFQTTYKCRWASTSNSTAALSCSRRSTRTCFMIQASQCFFLVLTGP